MPRHGHLALSLICLLAAPALAQWQAAPAFPASSTGRQHAVGLNLGGVLYALGSPPLTNGGDEDGSVHTMPSGVSAWTTRIGLDGIGGFIPNSPLTSGAAKRGGSAGTIVNLHPAVAARGDIDDAAADFNGDGSINTLDGLAFLDAWSAGC